MCCSVFQCVPVCSNALQCVAVCADNFSHVITASTESPRSFGTRNKNRAAELREKKQFDAMHPTARLWWARKRAPQPYCCGQLCTRNELLDLGGT